jgi:hypothetical protein
MPRKIFATGREEAVGTGGSFVMEDLRNLYSLTVVVRFTKSAGMRWRGDVAHMRAMSNEYVIVIGKPEEKMVTWKN